MNNVRRKELRSIITEIETVKTRLDSVLSDEQDAFDNLPEGLQCSMRGEDMEETIDAMESACDSLDEVIDGLSDLV